MSRQQWCATRRRRRCAPVRLFCAARRLAAYAAVCIGAILSPCVVHANDIATAEFYLQSGSGHQQGPFVGNYNVNTLLGADRFYNAGLTGSNAIMANIEAGYAWTGHETLAHAQLIPTSGSAAGEFDRHGTWVAMVMGGRQGGANPGDYQIGMAPDAQLFSGAIATDWPNNNPSFPRYTASFNYSPSSISTFGPYRAAFLNGLSTSSGLRSADVINSSFVASNSEEAVRGNDRFAGVIDALINENPRTLVTFAAGNTRPNGAGPNRVPSPASGYNLLAVAALTSHGGAFDQPSAFSNGGPNNYADPTGGFRRAARQVIDIAAPGEQFSLAYYGGQTGGNGLTVYGPADGPPGGPDYYTRWISGTSFAAPTVAGGAALLYDAAHSLLTATPDARDGRVMKSVLMNSAEKTLDWDNGQVPHANGNGGVLTSRGLDDRVGAGRMNLDSAFDQLLSGTTDVAGTGQGMLGSVDPIGWDFGLVTEGITNDYLIDQPLKTGSTFSATLNWFRERSTSGTTNFVEEGQDNLDLELWSSLGGTALELISESRSIYNNVEHFSFDIPQTGEYMLRVRWTSELFDVFGDANSEIYGLAWSGVAVPEPASIVLLAAGAALLVVRRRK